MDKKYNGSDIFNKVAIRSTPIREAVIRVLGDSLHPLSATEILKYVRRQISINKVTLYRILDLLVEKGVIRRLTSGDRAFRYGIIEERDHTDHAHFICTECGVMECLDPDVVSFNLKAHHNKIAGNLISNVEIIAEGMCQRCLAGKKDRADN
jgi:Fur family ferric uptake transcriptional regulator